MIRILVADDDSPTRDSIRYVLEDAGYQVIEAQDGRSTLEALATSSQPLIALIDLLMPGMQGVDVLRAIRDDALLASRHRYIGMTAGVGPMTPLADALLAQLHGPLLLKPFDIDTLLNAVSDALATLSASSNQRGAPPPGDPKNDASTD